jgi:hypothetical protein
VACVVAPMVKLTTQLRHGVADFGVVDIEVQAEDEEEVIESFAELIRLWRHAVAHGLLTEGIPPPGCDVVPGA